VNIDRRTGKAIVLEMNPILSYDEELENDLGALF